MSLLSFHLFFLRSLLPSFYTHSVCFISNVIRKISLERRRRRPGILIRTSIPRVERRFLSYLWIRLPNWCYRLSFLGIVWRVDATRSKRSKRITGHMLFHYCSTDPLLDSLFGLVGLLTGLRRMERYICRSRRNLTCIVLL